MRSQPMISRVRSEIDLSSFTANLRRIRRMIGPRVRLMVAVKKQAYGHGLVSIGRAAERHGADWLGVFSAAEGIQLREAGVQLPVLVFSVTPPHELAPAIRSRLTLTVTDDDSARAADRAAARVGRKAAVHLKLDTGMGRLGFMPTAIASSQLEAICGCTHLRWEGVYSHLASADSDLPYSRGQLAGLLDFVRSAPCRFPLVHLGASGSLPFPEFHLDLVRVGIAAYGGHDAIDGLKPVMRVTAPVLQVKEVPRGTSISYGRTFQTRHRTRIALIGAGYGDGYLRALSNRGWVCLRGQRAPIAGRVCMDQFMADVTRIRGVVPGDEAELIGPHVPVAQLARAADTISYELLCSLGRRLQS